jgi:2-iminobutanoate/2-iminopropanoate deaminase
VLQFNANGVLIMSKSSVRHRSAVCVSSTLILVAACSVSPRTAESPAPAGTVISTGAQPAAGRAPDAAAATGAAEKRVVGNPSRLLSPAIMAGNTLYLSGQLGTAGRDSGVAGETRAAIRNARSILQNAGLDLSDVIAVTAYLTDVGDYQAFNTAYLELFTTDPKPTRTTVIVKELVQNAKVELTMTAVRSK